MEKLCILTHLFGLLSSGSVELKSLQILSRKIRLFYHPPH